MGGIKSYKTLKQGSNGAPLLDASTHLAASHAPPTVVRGHLQNQSVWASAVAQWLRMFERLVQMRLTLLTASLPEGSPQFMRHLLLRKIDVEIARVLATLFRFTPRGPAKKRTKLWRNVVVFLQVIICIARKGRVRLPGKIEDLVKKLADFLELKAKLLQISRECQQVEKTLKPKNAGLFNNNKSPPEVPNDFHPDRFWSAPSVPRAERAPTFALPVAAG